MKSYRHAVAAAGLGLAVVATSAAGAAHAAAARPSLKPLEVAIHLDKARYAPYAKARITITMRNTGSHTLRPVGAACARAGDPDELRNTGRNWGRLAVQGAGVSLAPHRTYTFHVTAAVPAVAQRAGQVVVACDFGYRGVDSGYRPYARAVAKVPGQSGSLQGTLQYYVNGKSGAEAGLKGVTAVLVDPTVCPLRKRTATTDSSGRFTIRHAPAGKSYTLYLLLPKGWKLRDSQTDPVRAMVFGKDTVRMFFGVQHGTPSHRPTPPTKCR